MTWSNYANTGPFTNNVAPPGINATFLNNIETFLDQIVSTAAGDANITSSSGNMTVAGGLTVNGAGTALSVAHNISCAQILLTTGSLSRIKYTKIASVTTTPTLFNHNLGTTPDFCMVSVIGTSTGVFVVEWDDSSMTSTQVKLTSNSATGVAVGLIAFKA